MCFVYNLRKTIILQLNDKSNLNVSAWQISECLWHLTSIIRRSISWCTEKHQWCPLARQPCYYVKVPLGCIADIKFIFCGWSLILLLFPATGPEQNVIMGESGDQSSPPPACISLFLTLSATIPEMYLGLEKTQVTIKCLLYSIASFQMQKSTRHGYYSRKR